MLTNRSFARHAALIARRAASWTHDTMTMGDDYWDKPPIGDSVERFCADIESVLERLRAESMIKQQN